MQHKNNFNQVQKVQSIYVENKKKSENGIRYVCKVNGMSFFPAQFL